MEVVKATTTLEIDPIGTPMACRIYIDYKNVSTKTLSGVKFRIGYIDAEEKVRGTFHAPHGQLLAPGATAQEKWRGGNIDPRTNSVMIRVLVAKYSDGTIWESEKMKGLAPGTGGEGQTVAPAGGPASYATPAAQEAAAEAAGNSPPSSSGSGSPPAESQASPAGTAPSAAQPAGSDKSTDGY